VNRARPRGGIGCFRAAALVVLGVGVAVAVVRPRRLAVEGSSMEPGLTSGDRLLVLRRRRPRAGDVVALADPRGDGRLIVKRVVSVMDHQVVVEGDNTRSSTDSRVFGPVDRRAVVGRAVYRYFPPGRAGRLH